MNASGYYIKLINKNKNEVIGTIEYYYESDEQNINLANIHIEENYRGKSYGTFLIHLMLQSICEKSLNVKTISLDDCSDYVGTKECIYYKLGFRTIDESIASEMQLIFTPDKKEQQSIIETYKKKRKHTDIEDDIIIYKDVKQYCMQNHREFNFDADIEIERSEIIDGTLKPISTNIFERKPISKKSRNISRGGNNDVLDKRLLTPFIMNILKQMTMIKLKILAQQNNIKYATPIKKDSLVNILCKNIIHNTESF